MKIKIRRTADRGDLVKEKLILEVISDENIGNYVVMDTTFDDEGDVSNRGRHAYKFPSKDVKEGDFIWLYTKEADKTFTTEFDNTSKTKTHCFFWNRDATIWNQDGDHCYLMYIIDSKKV